MKTIKITFLLLLFSFGLSGCNSSNDDDYSSSEEPAKPEVPTVTAGPTVSELAGEWGAVVPLAASSIQDAEEVRLTTLGNGSFVLDIWTPNSDAEGGAGLFCMGYLEVIGVTVMVKPFNCYATDQTVLVSELKSLSDQAVSLLGEPVQAAITGIAADADTLSFFLTLGSDDYSFDFERLEVQPSLDVLDKMPGTWWDYEDFIALNYSATLTVYDRIDGDDFVEGGENYPTPGFDCDLPIRFTSFGSRYGVVLYSANNYEGVFDTVAEYPDGSYQCQPLQTTDDYSAFYVIGANEPWPVLWSLDVEGRGQKAEVALSPRWVLID